MKSIFSNFKQYVEIINQAYKRHDDLIKYSEKCSIGKEK
jgi:hypothetical protein